jgi:midasin
MLAPLRLPLPRLPLPHPPSFTPRFHPSSSTPAASLGAPEVGPLASAVQRAGGQALSAARERLSLLASQQPEQATPVAKKGRKAAQAVASLGKEAEALQAAVSELEAAVAAVGSAAAAARAPFQWADGPLVTAMREGDMILLDEINLAEDAVLERLNRQAGRWGF